MHIFQTIWALFSALHAVVNANCGFDVQCGFKNNPCCLYGWQPSLQSDAEWGLMLVKPIWHSIFTDLIFFSSKETHLLFNPFFPPNPFLLSNIESFLHQKVYYGHTHNPRFPSLWASFIILGECPFFLSSTSFIQQIPTEFLSPR